MTNQPRPDREAPPGPVQAAAAVTHEVLFSEPRPPCSNEAKPSPMMRHFCQ